MENNTQISCILFVNFIPSFDICLCQQMILDSISMFYWHVELCDNIIRQASWIYLNARNLRQIIANTNKSTAYSGPSKNDNRWKTICCLYVLYSAGGKEGSILYRYFIYTTDNSIAHIQQGVYYFRRRAACLFPPSASLVCLSSFWHLLPTNLRANASNVRAHTHTRIATRCSAIWPMFASNECTI